MSTDRLLDVFVGVKPDAQLLAATEQAIQDSVNRIRGMFGAMQNQSAAAAQNAANILNGINAGRGAGAASGGIKEMLKGLIYYEYVPKTNVMHTQTGLVSSLNENSTPQTEARGAQFIMNHYYKAIKTYNAIQWYIEQHKSDYPEYNGIPVEPQGMFI